MVSIFKKINLFFIRIFDFLSFRKKTDIYYHDEYDTEILCLNDDSNSFTE
jgi:hypothetical protein